MTDQDLLSEMQIAVLEVPDGGASWPSEAWTRDEALEALNAAQQMLIRDTQLLALRTEISVLAGATSVTLPADWMATLSANWRTVLNVRSPLAPSDTTEADFALPGWRTTPGTPLVYLDRDQASRTLRLAPIPDANGMLELLYVARPATITGNGVTLIMPPEYAYGAKWGALARMLRKVGRMQDPERASYCDTRYGLVKTLAEIILTGSYA